MVMGLQSLYRRTIMRVAAAKSEHSSMSTQELIVAVLLVLTLSSLVFAIGLLVGPRIRWGRDVADDVVVPPVNRPGSSVGPGAPSPGVVDSGRPIAVGSASASGPRPVASSTEAPRADSAYGAAAPGVAEPAKPIALDPVTGLDLAPTWSKWLADEGSRVDRYGHPATVVLVEVAGLDRLAERLGPEAVERLIPPIATTMRRQARASDNVARIGQARFGALLTETDEIRAINYVERARSACDIWLESGAVALRLSIGWAEIGATQPLEVAIQTAERRLNEERRRQRERPDLVPDAEPEV
jgi:diguanylate cyclase (GGDEF)-like protein